MFKKIKGKIARLALVGVILSTAIMAVIVPTTAVYASTDIDTAVSSSTDDARYYQATAVWTYNAGDVVTYCGSVNAANDTMGIGMVFDNITIPVGSTIDDAYFSVQSHTDVGTAMKSEIYGQDSDTAVTFANEADFKNRWGVNGGTDLRTTAHVHWDDQPDWTAAQWYNAPDIKAIIQEIIGNVGWASGNGIALTWNDFSSASADGNYRWVFSYDQGAASAPKLHITYTSVTHAVTTNAPSNIAVISAQMNGTLDNLGGEASSECYFEWDVDSGAPYANDTSATHDDMGGTGAFSEVVSGFTPADIIYYRAASNNGISTVYGAEQHIDLLNYSINYMGDSVTVGVGASVHANSWQELVEAAIGYDENNVAISATRLGNFTSGQTSEFYGQTYTTDSTSMALLGYNDMRYWGTTATALIGFSNAVKADLAFAALPTASVLESDNVAIAYTGTWSNAAPWTGVNTKFSNVAGSTATATLTGSTVYVSTIQFGGYSAGIQVSIDGTNKGTFNNTGYPDTCAPYLLRFSGLTNVAHTVVVTVTAGTGYAYLDWMGASDGTPDGGTVYVAGSLKMQNYATYPPYSNGSDGAVTQYNSVIQTAVSELAGDGLDIIYVDVNAYFNVATDFTGGDGVHPNDTGYDHIADAFLAAFGGAGTVSGHTDDATLVTTTTATLNGEVTDMGGELGIDCYFEYGATVAYGSDTLANKDTLAGVGAFDVGIATLLSGTIYHYRAVLEYGGAYVYG
ncbi:MAG: hypothetical protein IMZ64_06355, partial [Bacteroidetes bacterium]|nr:hypothetical protein [Bacteroidota bacterium]